MYQRENQKILQKLQRMSEKSLIDRLILPLLEKYDFDSIEQRHGALERGVDILCLKRDEIDDVDVLAIQVKKFKFSGSATASGHLHGVLIQLSQCIEEPIKMKDGSVRYANRIWLISPYPLTISALEASFAKYIKSGANRIRVIDGERLLSLLYKNAPSLLAQLGDKLASYLERIENEFAHIQESAAFRVGEKISLLPIYISLDISVMPQRILEILNHRIETSGRRDVLLTPEKANSWIEFNKKINGILAISPLELVTNSKSGPRESQAGSPSMVKQVSLRADPRLLYDSIRTATLTRISELEQSIARNQPPSSEALVKFARFIQVIEDASTHEAFYALLNPIPRYLDPKLDYDRIGIGADELLESRCNYQIIGEAGAGKTTLLRVIGHKEASRRTGRVPVLLPLSALSTRQSILSLVQQVCNQKGLSTSKKSLIQLMENGRILLLLDGLDEASSRVTGIKEEILGLMSIYKSTQFIFTSRPWSALSRHIDFFTIKVLPFTRAQVKEFFTNWFANDPTHAAEIHDHLQKNPQLYEVISTPLVATVFAVVKLFGGKLPTSLLELYEERLRLLLHDWDSAKSVRRDHFEVADKRHLLRKLAFEMHSKRIRSIPWESLITLCLETVGEIKNKEQATSFMIELVQNNNMLVQTDDDKWGFEHLQYQEHLAAIEAKENPRIRLVKYMRDGWWSSVVKMYAQMTRDISPMIYHVYDTIQQDLSKAEAQQGVLLKLEKLLRLAPNTEARARQILEREISAARLIHRYSGDDLDEEILRPIDTDDPDLARLLQRWEDQKEEDEYS